MQPSHVRHDRADIRPISTQRIAALVSIFRDPVADVLLAVRRLPPAFPPYVGRNFLGMDAVDGLEVLANACGRLVGGKGMRAEAPAAGDEAGRGCGRGRGRGVAVVDAGGGWLGVGGVGFGGGDGEGRSGQLRARASGRSAHDGGAEGMSEIGGVEVFMALTAVQMVRRLAKGGGCAVGRAGAHCAEPTVYGRREDVQSTHDRGTLDRRMALLGEGRPEEGSGRG